MLLPPTPSSAPAKKASDPLATPSFFEETLANGLHLRFYDQTNRYFGDYHRVRIVVTINLGLNNALLADSEHLAAAISRFGATLTTSKVLERMGVPSARVAPLRAELVASYRLEARNYLSRPEVPLRLLRAELAVKPSASTILRMLR